MPAKKKIPDVMVELQTALEEMLAMVPHFSWLGGASQQHGHDMIRRARVLLDPEPPAQLTEEMRALISDLKRVVDVQRQRIADNDAKRKLEAETLAANRAELTRQREEDRQRKIALGATPL